MNRLEQARSLNTMSYEFTAIFSICSGAVGGILF